MNLKEKNIKCKYIFLIMNLISYLYMIIFHNVTFIYSIVYLSLISNNPIINKIMNNFNYKYKMNLEKNNLTVDEYYDYFIKYFYKFLKFQRQNS